MSSGELYEVPSWRPIKVSQVTEDSRTLKIEPQSCKVASELNSTLQPPGDLYGYKLVQGTSFVNGNFTYEFWLYCDPSLKPGDNEHFSGIEGLGIYSSWRYTGPSVEGANQYYFEFEPNNPLGKTSWNGPLDKTSVTGVMFGIEVPEATLKAKVQEQIPVQFRVLIDSPLGQDGATLSFNLEATEPGYRVANLNAESSFEKKQ
jgi:hypothetical protein